MPICEDCKNELKRLYAKGKCYKCYQKDYMQKLRDDSKEEVNDDGEKVC